ncbi:MAG: DUF3313 domain-containing protein [Nitrospirae bacterium]|nr:DUF3313 domain-containing protein [Nitrospirota bacterium]
MTTWLSVLALTITLLVGCSPTKQARSMEESGFLGTLYPLMHKGSDDEALLVYRNPKVLLIPRGTYKKILLDPVQIWNLGATDTDKEKDLQQVANLLHSLVYKSLAKDFEMVTSPGPNTLRIQAALTGAEKTNVVLRTLSSVPAPMNVFFMGSTIKTVFTGKPAFVGEISAEIKFIDSTSGEVLGASADRRVGKKRLDADSFDSWDDVNKAMESWAETIRYRLCQQRGAPDCVKPKA